VLLVLRHLGDVPDGRKRLAALERRDEGHAGERPAQRRFLGADRRVLQLRARRRARPELQHGDVRAEPRGVLPLLPASPEDPLTDGRPTRRRNRRPIPFTEEAMTETKDLIARIESLERKNRRLVRIGGVALVALASLGAMSLKSACDTVSAERVVLLDTQGHQRALLSAYDTGGGPQPLLD